MLKNINTEELFRSMTNQKVLVVGDIMIDAYLSGDVDRISPEAPVPVVSLNERVSRPGGAANVAMNLQALGAEPWICSVTGDDKGRNDLLELLSKKGIHTEAVIADSSRPTTTKFRIIGNRNHMLRVDEESTHDLSSEIEDSLIKKIETLLEKIKPSLVILQDYNKGVLTKKVIRYCIDQCNKRGIITTVDPKKKNFNEFYEASIFKPNLKEFSEGINESLNPAKAQTMKHHLVKYQQDHNIPMMLVTLSEYGICYSKKENNGAFDFGHFNAEVREISDVSGAGDTVISVASLAYASCGDAAVSTQLANLAGGIVCEYSGVVSINKDDLFQEFQRYLHTNE